MTVPADQPLTITRGDSFDMLVTVRQNGTPVNLTGATVTGQVRETADSATVLCTFDCVLANQTTNVGLVTCSLDKTETAALTVSTATYDIQIDWLDGRRQTFLSGDITVRKDVTK